MSWFERPALRSPFAAAPGMDAPADDGAGGPLRILTVCTGNICRSAWAHHVLQARLDAALGADVVEVSSAGTGPNQALAVPEELLTLAPDAGVRAALAAHRPRRLTARVLAGQDLVLTATEAHRDAVVREAPAALRRSATLLDAGALLADPDAVAPGGGGRALVAALEAARREGRGLDAGRRGLLPAGRRAADLADPFRGPAEGYTEMTRALEPALAAVEAAVVRAVEPAR